MGLGGWGVNTDSPEETTSLFKLLKTIDIIINNDIKMGINS